MSPVVSSLRTAGQQHDVAGFISGDNRKDYTVSRKVS